MKTQTKPKAVPKNRLIKISEVAEIMGLSINTIRNYANGGYKDSKRNVYVLCPVKNFPKPAKVLNSKTRLWDRNEIIKFANLK